MSENHIEYTEDDLRERIDSLESERDLWKSKAEKLAEALNSVSNCGSANCDCRDEAKEALAEFEKETK